jgi:hypothetical protein
LPFLVIRAAVGILILFWNLNILGNDFALIFISQIVYLSMWWCLFRWNVIRNTFIINLTFLLLLFVLFRLTPSVFLFPPSWAWALDPVWFAIWLLVARFERLMLVIENVDACNGVLQWVDVITLAFDTLFLVRYDVLVNDVVELVVLSRWNHVIWLVRLFSILGLYFVIDLRFLFWTTSPRIFRLRIITTFTRLQTATLSTTRPIFILKLRWFKSIPLLLRQYHTFPLFPRFSNLFI